MPRISTVIYSIKQGIKSLKRNRMFSVASIATMTACLFLFGIFYFLLSNLSHAIKNAETNVGVTVFFEEGISDAQIIAIGEEITLRAEVAYITFVSAEEAWERYKETSLNPEQIASFGEDNPLENSASYEVYLSDVSMQEVLVRYITSLEGVRQVNDSQEVANALNMVNRIVSIMTTIITGILIAVAVFLISTTISTGVSTRKQELSIMKLIGATDFFIKAPFFVEGLLLGMFGAILPLLGLYGIYHKIADFVSEKYASVFGTGMSLLGSAHVFARLIPICFAIGIGIGVLGTWLTLNRQLKKLN
ncbi:MAG: permease-like cell division protein FtsX [Lachnospiraceae bacterium]|nr:permease-like cell division protein FtsX [Lachnospiraceae bacterium]